MKPKMIQVTYERKFNMGDYNSLHVGLSLWADLDEGEDHIEATRKLQQDARDLARTEYQRVVKAGKAAANGTV